MKTVKVYNVTWWENVHGDKDNDPEKSLYVDSTQVDENNEELIWQLFEEFGYEKYDRTFYTVEEAEEQLEDNVYESIYGNINID